MSRPFVLDPLFRPVTALPGVGPRIGHLLGSLVGGEKIQDVLFHAPVDCIDRRFAPPVSKAPEGAVITVEVMVGKHFPAAKRGLPYKVWCQNADGTLNLVFFNPRADWITKQLPEGRRRVISGRAQWYNGALQIVHPDYIVPPETRSEIPAIEPVYPLTAGITNARLQKVLAGALAQVPVLPEWLDEAHKKRERWPDWHEGITALHKPQSPESVSTACPAQRRLAYDELLANQLTLALVRNRQRKKAGRSFSKDSAYREKMLQALPFALTGAQRRALAQIDENMAAPSRMLRLLQGDVGSGKTVVAMLAMMNAVGHGAQAALMAPTEILARQHADTLKPWLEAAGIHMAILTGRDKGTAREHIKEDMASGAAQVVIGTHALFQKDIAFADLGMVVIDEQHRFGVHQRLLLSEKGKGVDVLVMTATPIPRTLSLTAYGDMDISVLDEKPPGRKPVDTRLFPLTKMEAVVAALQRQIRDGARAYWVCPLVEESEVLNLAAAEARFDVLKETFGERVGLIHGRMAPADKDKTITQFVNGDLDVLVATTVIEVGVNVPDATIMVIEHAERFGLAQLHQLRGRVGRGRAQSYCFLLYAPPLNDTAKQRLSVMRQTEDGFVIAEKDLDLRGGGDVLGVRQSGLPVFKIADLSAHKDLLITAADDAKMIMHKDPDLTTPRGQALKVLLYLFEQDQAIRYLRSG